MHIQVSNHALIDKFGLREVSGKLDPLRLRHLARNGELHLAGKLGVLANLERLDIVPEPFAVGPLLRCVLGQQHLGMDDAALGGKVLHAVDALVAHPRGRAVGGGGHRARSGLAADDLDVEMIDSVVVKKNWPRSYALTRTIVRIHSVSDHHCRSAV